MRSEKLIIGEDKKLVSCHCACLVWTKNYWKPMMGPQPKKCHFRTFLLIFYSNYTIMFTVQYVSKYIRLVSVHVQHERNLLDHVFRA
jgi:hypothetical protein